MFRKSAHAFRNLALAALTALALSTPASARFFRAPLAGADSLETKKPNVVVNIDSSLAGKVTYSIVPSKTNPDRYEVQFFIAPGTVKGIKVSGAAQDTSTLQRVFLLEPGKELEINVKPDNNVNPGKLPDDAAGGAEENKQGNESKTQETPRLPQRMKRINR